MAGAAFGGRMQYSYPILERKEILASVTQLGYGGLTEENLTKASAEVVGPLYEFLALYLLSIAREELQQPVIECLDFLEFEELHIDALGTWASINSISTLMFAAGATDFSHKDIVRPDPGRTVCLLSAIINYAMFRQEKEQAIADAYTEVNALREDYQRLHNRFDELNRGIALKAAETEAEQPHVQSSKVEIKELDHAASNLNKQHAALQNDTRSLKQELNSTTAQIANNRSLLVQKKQESFQLKGRIVQSPDKLQKMFEDKRLARETVKAAAVSTRDSVCKRKRKLDTYLKVNRKFCRWLNMIIASDKHTTLYKKVSKDLKEMKIKLKLNEEEDWSLSSNLQDLDIEERHVQDLVQKLEAAWSSKCEEADRQMEEAKLQSEPTLAEHQKLRTKTAELHAQVEDSSRQTMEVMARDEGVANALVEERDKLRHEVTNYRRRMDGAIYKFNPLFCSSSNSRASYG